MKKIVLYTIGALCLFGQNGIGSDHPTEAIPSMRVNQIGESEPKKPSEEMIKLSEKIIPYITQKTGSGKVLSWSDFSQLYSSLEKFRILFSEEYNSPLNKITIHLCIPELEKKDEYIVRPDDLFSDWAFVVRGQENIKGGLQENIGGNIQKNIEGGLQENIERKIKDITMIIWKKDLSYSIIKN